MCERECLYPLPTHPPSLVLLLLSLPDMLWWRDKLKVILREQRLCSGMCGMTLSCSVDKKHIRGWYGVIWACVITAINASLVLTTWFRRARTVSSYNNRNFLWWFAFIIRFPKKHERKSWELNHYAGEASIQKLKLSKNCILCAAVCATKALIVVLRRSEMQGKQGKQVHNTGEKNGTQLLRQNLVKIRSL